MTPTKTKKCSNPKCRQAGLYQPLTDFHKLSGTPDGHRPNCQDCCNTAARQYRAIKRSGEVPIPTYTRSQLGTPITADHPSLVSQGGKCRLCNVLPSNPVLNMVAVTHPGGGQPSAVCIKCAFTYRVIADNIDPAYNTVRFLNGKLPTAV
jgi:hypothetical protein